MNYHHGEPSRYLVQYRHSFVGWLDDYHHEILDPAIASDICLREATHHKDRTYRVIEMRPTIYAGPIKYEETE